MGCQHADRVYVRGVHAVAACSPIQWFFDSLLDLPFNIGDRYPYIMVLPQLGHLIYTASFEIELEPIVFDFPTAQSRLRVLHPRSTATRGHQSEGPWA